MRDDKITIHLSDEEAIAYRAFCANRTLMEALVDAKALDVISGSVIINYDAKGKIGSIEVKRHYRLSPPLDN